MQLLRDRIERSLGVSGSRDEIIAAADLRARGGDPFAAEAALQDLAQIEAISGRMAGPGASGGSAQGSFATLMDQIFGRGTAEQQLDEIKQLRTAAQDQKTALNMILKKMDEEPPRDIWTDGV